MYQKNILNHTEALDDDHKSVCIEHDFPTEELNKIARQESWRKEIYRPIYHIHKWWATRLGSVFRAIVIGAFAPKNKSIWEYYYSGIDLKNKIILDPFMGSGTTLGEAVKLGSKAIGCDINPVSKFIVKQSFTKIDENKLRTVFSQLKGEVSEDILQYYKTIEPETGESINVLYYFWVKIVKLPNNETIPLFSRYIFSQNAYPKKKPKAQCICTKCWSVFETVYNASSAVCPVCRNAFNPQIGPAKGASVVDSQGNKFKIKDLVPKDGSLLEHKLYALLAVNHNGDKVYLSIKNHDVELYNRAAERLKIENVPLPTIKLREGYNTKQATGYNYMQWSDFFNDRQLLCLGILLRAIIRINDVPLQEHMLCLFSGTLEFNNLFCSFKGEGTGAVRHMFNNHILKPEKTPLENSVWGTRLSSGTFATLFESRIIPAKRYYENPFEIQISVDELGRNNTSKTYSRKPMNVQCVNTWEDFTRNDNQMLLFQGNSADLCIPDKIVDAIITDPPYFDYIHYSELSDFFYAWLSLALKGRYQEFSPSNSSAEGEVQQHDPVVFAEKLSEVFRECNRVLKEDGLLIFSFHHSKAEGWAAISNALTESGFIVTAIHPVYSEFIGSSIKSVSNDPISSDTIIVCRKHEYVINCTNSIPDVSKLLERHSSSLSGTNYKVLKAASMLIEFTRNKRDYQFALAELIKIYSNQDES